MSERHLEVLVPGVSVADVTAACAGTEPWPPGTSWLVTQTTLGADVILQPDAAWTLSVLDRWPVWIVHVDTAQDAYGLSLRWRGRSVYGESLGPDGYARITAQDACWWASAEEADRELGELASRRAREAAAAVGLEVVPARRAWDHGGDPFPREHIGPTIEIGTPAEPLEDDEIPW